MGKFYSPGQGKKTWGPTDIWCTSGAAQAFDKRTGKCFNIYGLGVLIEDKVASVHAGFETFNQNVHMDGYQPACVNCYQLPGAVV